jgi:hypothetical protein
MRLEAQSANPRRNLGCGVDLPLGHAREDRAVHGQLPTGLAYSERLTRGRCRNNDQGFAGFSALTLRAGITRGAGCPGVTGRSS